MKVCDFTNSEFGMVVKHSPHWVKESNYAPDRHKIGIIVDRKFYKDEVAGVICFPSVHWEGSVTDFACHPANIVPYRKRQRDRIKWVEVSG